VVKRGGNEMEEESLNLEVVLPVSPKKIYDAWLSSQGHSKFTGAKAKIEPTVGSNFSAWDDYISGKILALDPGKRILQSWRTTEFNENDPDSMLEVLIQPEDNKTRLRLRHWNIPEGEASKYEEGWQEFYFRPMKEYFKQF
jgi:activator of HSP90 ATPase